MDREKYVRLVFVRHTQTDLNAQRRYSGAKEKAFLDEVGKAQADALASQFAQMPIAAIYASDLYRTRQVASRIAKACKLDVYYDWRLREVDIGSMGGLTKAEAMSKFSLDHFRTNSLVYDFTTIGGESRDYVIKRQLGCFQDILELHARETHEEGRIVVVVGHGTSLRTMLQHLGIEPPKLHKQGDFQFVPFYL